MRNLLLRSLIKKVIKARAIFEQKSEETACRYAKYNLREITYNLPSIPISRKHRYEINCHSYWDRIKLRIYLNAFFWSTSGEDVKTEKYAKAFSTFPSPVIALNIGMTHIRTVLGKLSDAFSSMTLKLTVISESLHKSKQLTYAIEEVRECQLELGNVSLELASIEESLNKFNIRIAHAKSTFKDPDITPEVLPLLEEQFGLLCFFFSITQKKAERLKEFATELMSQISARLGSNLELTQRKVDRSIRIFTFMLSSLVLGSTLGSLYTWYV